MKKNEIVLLEQFMEELAQRFSADGCNDYFLEDTAENRDLIRDAYLFDEEEPRIIRVFKGMLACDNTVILSELQRRLRLGGVES